MSDEGFHEIQLNGKQLIFLCMTAALVLVVAFLSGVLVGRGVRSQKDANVIADTAAAPSPAGVEPTAANGTPAAQAQAPPPITAIAPPTPADEDLSYNSRLEGKEPPKETVKPQSAEPPAPAPAPAKGAPAKAQAANNDPAKAAPPVKEATAPKALAADASKGRAAEVSLPGEPTGPGYYLKCAAFKERGQADSVARRLSGKGYNAYVVPTSSRGPVLYSVRVGKYKTRKEADSIRRRLEKEEQYKPLIAH